LSDRFYKQQLASTGNCPGASITQTKRKKNMSWTDEKKAQAVALYEAAEPTPETSVEIVKEIALDLDESPNGVRMILTKQGVYIKKVASAASAKTSNSATGSTRVSKADAQQALVNAITDSGQEVDEEIVSKLTGKAAVYFTAILTAK
tara:strand:+ start:102 stop:545 length:444 start_codon:yes stop_codon:yes gene_type:complete